ncbi:hypothetical protein DKL51_23425, partial [Micromonospora globispora]
LGTEQHTGEPWPGPEQPPQADGAAGCPASGHGRAGPGSGVACWRGMSWPGQRPFGCDGPEALWWSRSAGMTLPG